MAAPAAGLTLSRTNRQLDGAPTAPSILVSCVEPLPETTHAARPRDRPRRLRRRTADGLPALSIYFRDPDGNLLELMAADGSAAE